MARIVIPGLGHHVSQRGNNGQDVFFVDDDRRLDLELLGGDDEDMAGRIGRSAHSGPPLATDGVLRKLERTIGRRLRVLPVGRPRKNPRKAEPRRAE